MVKLALWILFFSLFVFTSTASEESISGTSSARSSSSSTRERVRLLPAEIPRSWLRGKHAAGQQRTRPPASLVSTKVKGELADGNETLPGSEKNSNGVVNDFNAKKGKEVARNRHVQDTNNQGSSQELLDDDAMNSKPPNANNSRDTSKPSPVHNKILSEADMIHDLQSGRIQLGHISPKTKLNSSVVEHTKSDSVHLQDDNSIEASSSNDSKEVLLKLTDTNRSLESESNGSTYEESLEDKLEASSEENNSTEPQSQELIEEAQNSQRVEGASADDPGHEEQSGENLKGTVNIHDLLRTQTEKNESVVIPVNHQSVSMELAELNETVSAITEVEEHKEISFNTEPRQEVDAEHRRSSAKTNKATGINEDPNLAAENLKIRSENNEQMAETIVPEGTSMTMKDYLTEAQGNQKDIVESERKQTQVEKIDQKTSNIENVTNPTSQSIQASQDSDGTSTQKVSNSVQGPTTIDASKSTPIDQTKGRNPLALFPKASTDTDKAKPSVERPPVVAKNAPSSPADSSNSNRNLLQPNLSVHPKLKGKVDDHEQPKISSVVSLDVESENPDNEKSREVVVHPKLGRKTGSSSTGAGSRRTVFHPKLMPKSVNSGTRETSNESPTQQGNEEAKSREIVHPKLVDSGKQTQEAGTDIHAGSIEAEPQAQDLIGDAKSGEAVHPKLVGSSKQTQHIAKDENSSAIGNKVQDSINANSTVDMEQLYQDIFKKIGNASKGILDIVSNSTISIREQTQIRIEKVSKEIMNKNKQEVVSAQARREKAGQLSNMVSTIAIALIVLVTIATIIGAIFKKLSFTRQRYGEHLPLSTEEDDEDLPLYNRYQSSYESWKDMH